MTSLAHERYRPTSRRRPAKTEEARPLRVGVLGLSAESPIGLIEPLSRAALPVRAISIHLLGTPGTSGRAPGAGVSFTHAILDEPLDGLVLVGAPNEPDVEPEALENFRELMEIVEYARGFVPSTLGLGTGGLLLARALGLQVVALSRGVHGLVPHRVLRRDHPLLGRGNEVFFAAEDRTFRITDASMDAAVGAGRVTALAHSRDGGVSLFESSDGRCVAHLGHPERKPPRIGDDGRLSAFYDSARESARAHAAAFFEAWVMRVNDLGERGRARSRP
ncbi:MAG TPA: homoserine O-succinyltransferase [Polyangiaceae bacterium]|nr:homoserine O-succinyltransferase [Polyangiaceae bacterium]